jgi:two-component system cell cycle sensor histidine kinase/response regulator CckA
MANKPTYEESEQRVKESEKSLHGKRAGEALHEDEKQYRRLADSLSALVYCGDPKTLAATYVNRAVEKLYGYTVEEWLEDPDLWEKTIHPDDREGVLAEYMEAESKLESAILRYRGIRKDKEIRWMEDHVSWEKDAQGNAVSINGLLYDITDQKRAEEALRQSEGKLNAMLRAIGDHMSMMDKDLNIIWANETAKRMFGDDLIGKKCFEAYHGRKEPCEPYPCLALKAFHDGEVHKHETQVIDKHGKVKHFHCTANVALRDQQGKPTAVIEISRDISEHKRAEEALRIKDTAIASSINGIALADLDGSLTYVNASFLKMWGYDDHGEVVGKHVLEFWNRKKNASDVIKALCNGGGWIGELDAIKKDGSMFHVQVSASMVVDNNGKPVCMMSSFIDVTEHRREQEKRKKLEAQFQRAQKMEAIGTLAGGIAHDFNNLLMTMQGNVSLMLSDIGSSHPHYEGLKEIEGQVRSAAKLTKQLLGYARKGKYKIEPVDLNELVKRTSESFCRTRREISVHRGLATGLFAIKADQGHIEQVLFNLYVNAADAMPGGGDLTLKTMNVTHEDMEGGLYSPKPGNYVLLTVTDTGIGMNQETQERIFEPFFTTKRPHRGTGLGLSSVYGMVKGHAGYIDVESERGRGTTFSIYLPATEEKVEKSVKASEPVITGSGTILFVDDSKFVLKVGGALLERLGYTVFEAVDGREALEIYETKKDEVDLVVLDMIMPHMGGGEAYDRIKEFNPNVKVLLASGYSIDSQARKILSRGCNGFIQKPFTIKELSLKIKEILDEK